MPGRINHNGARFGMVAAAIIPDYAIVEIDDDGKAILCTAGLIGTGFVQEGAPAIGDDLLVYEFCGEAPALAGETWAVKNYLKPGADGKLVKETDPAVPTAFTRAQAAEAATVLGQPYLVRWIR